MINKVLIFVFAVIFLPHFIWGQNTIGADSLAQGTQKEKPFAVVEQMPSFPGGNIELYKYIAENFRIPVDVQREEGICTRVTARFVVEADGSISNIQILRTCYDKAHKAFIDMIKSMPRWIPGKQNGKNVAVYYTLPINIRVKINDND
ncbi:hypothetical protein D0T84_07020 [Dysgonomonas sp. 521]|uniref:energy transducer TonB n=1 Tax=Dysgonomonas sp. 521 TaxID=2302932 RepID=UPI0013D4572E|nr:energy transducer TonB [Dysgonomonas sp. 521]NDV94670.1 hypothetical protein [Dysgonomonas sp. 521]